MQFATTSFIIYLNLFVSDLKSSTKKAVIVYMHGGSFYEGSGNDDIYGPDFLIEEDVVLVREHK